MKDSWGGKLISISGRVYKALMYIFPTDFRREYGPLIAQAFSDISRDAFIDGNFNEIIYLWVRSMSDLVGSAIAEHLNSKERAMRLRRILLQEIIRAIALGSIAFLFLALVKEPLGLSSRQFMTVLGLIVLGIFITFTALRLKTGRELMAITKRDWTIVGVVTTFTMAAFIGISEISGRVPRGLGFPWSVVIGVFAIALFTWLGYRAAVRHRQRSGLGEDDSRQSEDYQES